MLSALVLGLAIGSSWSPGSCTFERSAHRHEGVSYRRRISWRHPGTTATGEVIASQNSLTLVAGVIVVQHCGTKSTKLALLIQQG